MQPEEIRANVARHRAEKPPPALTEAVVVKLRALLRHGQGAARTSS